MTTSTIASAAPRPPTTRARLALLATATAVGSVGLAAGGLAGPLLAADLTGDPATAGLPIGVHVAGSAVGAVLVSRVSARAGRPAGLALGYLVGVAGAVIVVVAAAWAGFGLLLAGSAVFGAGNASVFLARYAAAATSGPATRGRALGILLFAVAAGAVTGPNLLAAGGRLASAAGLPALTGLYLISIASFLVAAALLARLMLILEKAGHQSDISPSNRPVSPRSTSVGALRGRGTVGALRGRGTVVPVRAVLLLAVTNLVMVGVMAVAPVHLVGHGHGPAVVGGIVSAHVLCMFVPSIVSGPLLDRAGPAVMTSAAALLLAASGVVAATGADDDVALVVSLALLGIGWNAGVLAGSALLTAAVPPEGRLRAEGLGEVAMGLAAGGGAPVAGLVMASGGFVALGAGTAIVVLVVAVPVAATLATRLGLTPWVSRVRRRAGRRRRPSPGGQRSSGRRRAWRRCGRCACARSPR